MDNVNETLYRRISQSVAASVTAATYALAYHLKPPREIDWLAIGWGMATLAITVFVLFQLLFEKLLWRQWPFSKLMTVPDLSGWWQGELVSISHRRRHWSVVQIRQTFGHVFYRSEREDDAGRRVSAEHTIACIVRRDARSDTVELMVIYTNEVGQARDHHGHNHEGCTVVRLNGNEATPSSWTLNGHYWTGKPYPDPDGPGGTRGLITLTRLASEAEWNADEALQKRAMARTSPRQVQELDAAPHQLEGCLQSGRSRHS